MTVADPSSPPPASAHPLLSPWGGPFEAPPFDAIRTEHYRPAFEEALAQNKAEIAAITG